MINVKKKLVVIGDENCGKTSLLKSFGNNKRQEEDIDSSTEEYSQVNIEVHGKQVLLEMYETVCQEEHNIIRPYAYIDSHVMLIVFSLVHHASFDRVLEKWIPEVKHFCPEVPFIIVGNKKDLTTDQSTLRELANINLEPIKKEEAMIIAKKKGAFAYMECSAATNEGIRAVLETAARCALQERTHNYHKLNCNLM